MLHSFQAVHCPDFQLYKLSPMMGWALFAAVDFFVPFLLLISNPSPFFLYIASMKVMVHQAGLRWQLEFGVLWIPYLRREDVSWNSPEKKLSKKFCHMSHCTLQNVINHFNKALRLSTLSWHSQRLLQSKIWQKDVPSQAFWVFPGKATATLLYPSHWMYSW